MSSKYKTVGVTGNRPHKLPPEAIALLKNRIDEICHNFVTDGGELLIQGAALGTDTWFALSALNHDLAYRNYIPFPQQADSWNSEDRETYQYILDHSADNKVFGATPDNQCFFVRNAAIVNDSDIMVVVHGADVTSGGAIWTMKYALNNNKPILQLIVHEDHLEEKWIPSK